MGKRSDFERKPRDFYPTPFAAVEPLIQHLPQGFAFAEPCADITDCYYLGSYVDVKELLLEFLGILFRWKGICHDKISLLFWTSAHSNRMGQIYVRQR